MTSTPVEPYGPILQALATMQASVAREQKQQANDYLEAFQKSPEAWTLTHTILQSPDVSLEAKLFAATTLKGKITYDIHQLPRESLPQLRDSLLALLFAFRVGRQNRVIRTQLCVCLAILAVQMMEWKDVINVVVSALGRDADGSVCLLEFLKVLPEEVTDGRKVNLTEEEIDSRTKELLEDNALKVLELLVQYAQSSATAATEPVLTSCLTSWLREVPVIQVVNSPLMDIVINALSSEDSFDEAVECLCSIFRETRDVDECQDVIEILYPRLLYLQPKIAEAVEDSETFKGYTRLFAEAGEAWVVLIARLPVEFRSLVQAISECAARDKEHEVISLTFNFWYELKNYLVLEKYIEARMQLADIYANLVDIMIQHLHYPIPESGNEEELFDGDREQEERFREFRHAMGDVLKDCCEVLGSRDCLAKAFNLIQAWMQRYTTSTPTSQGGIVANWQSLEAPLFSLRAMGRMVPPEENEVLPQIMTLLVQLPEHQKVRFAATLVLGRYTEWTANHPEFLESQLNYITSGFQHGSKEVMQAAAMALRFFCQDCGKLLVGHIGQLHTFYEHVSKDLPWASLDEVTDGVAHIVAAQPIDNIYESLKLFCLPITTRLMERANTATDDKSKNALADNIQLLTIFAGVVRPYIEPGMENPMIRFWSEVFPILSKIVETFITCSPVCERVSKFWRTLLLSYRTATLPLLPTLAEKLVACFEKSRQGCFLWVSASVVREFQDEEVVSKETRDAVYQFLERQCLAMFQIMNEMPPKEIPDLIEDFFRLLSDAVMFHPLRLVPSTLLEPIFKAALTSLVLEQNEPLIAVLHFLRDILSYGTALPLTSGFNTEENPKHLQDAVLAIVRRQGEDLTVRILSGLMYSFPRDCVPDSSGVLMSLVELVPAEACAWVAKTVSLLPAGSISDEERQKFMANFQKSVVDSDWKKVRYQLQDFTNWYRRRNVTPRHGGSSGLSTPRFKF